MSIRIDHTPVHSAEAPSFSHSTSQAKRGLADVSSSLKSADASESRCFAFLSYLWSWITWPFTPSVKPAEVAKAVREALGEQITSYCRDCLTAKEWKMATVLRLGDDLVCYYSDATPETCGRFEDAVINVAEKGFLAKKRPDQQIVVTTLILENRSSDKEKPDLCLHTFSKEVRHKDAKGNVSSGDCQHVIGRPHSCVIEKEIALLVGDKKEDLKKDLTEFFLANRDKIDEESQNGKSGPLPFQGKPGWPFSFLGQPTSPHFSFLNGMDDPQKSLFSFSPYNHADWADVEES